MTADKKVDAAKATKKKTRRKKRSKCSLTTTSNFAIEKSPFKEKLDNGISITLGCDYDHILGRRLHEDNLPKGTDLLRNVMNVKVGVAINSLLNDELRNAINFQPLIVELEKLLKQHRRLDIHKKLGLERVALVFPDRGAKETFSTKEVYHALYFVVSHTVPPGLLGSKDNLKVFMKSARRLVFGCHKQSYSLTSMVNGLKASQIPWLQNALPSNSLRLHVLACLAKWLHLYVQVIIQGLFHLTVHTSKEIIFYDKKVWSKLQRNETCALVSTGKIRKADPGSEDMMKMCDVGRTQFLIKKQGLRPITIFRKSSDVASVLLKKQARLLLAQLAYVTGCLHTPFSSRLDCLLQEGLLKIVSCYPDPTSRPIFYFVRADVKDAFGSINHKKMLVILQNLHKTILPPNNKIAMCRLLQNKKIVERFECPQMPLTSLPQHIKLESKTIDLKPILLHIRNHVHRLGTMLGATAYRITDGIPQGMHLSTILCELYLNSLDREHLQAFQQTRNGELFIRYCDDYLFISTVKERAEAFLEKVSAGFPDFHIHFNADKTVTNVGSEMVNVAFCGYNISLDTFTVEGNFDAYENQNIAHTISMKKTEKIGRVLLARMKIVLKLSPILVDKRLNSKHVVAENIYKAALFMAFRFCAFVNYCCLAKKMNQKHVIRCVKEGSKFLRKRVVAGIRKSVGSKNAGNKWISSDEIKWLVFQAFIARMNKNGSLYSKALAFLKSTCKTMANRMQAYQMKLLQKSSSPSLPGVFSTMKW